MRSNRRAWLGVTALAAVVLTATYASTASNTVGATQAGDGTGTISGFVVSSVKYNLNTSSPNNIDTVTFNLDSTPPSGSTLKVQLASAGTWYTCTNSAAAVTCTVTSPQATVSAATNLRVVVAQ